MKEKVKETLKKMGFELEPQDDRAFVFQYEGVNYLYVYNKDDKSFLMFMVHYDTEDMSQQELFKLANTFNNRVKYVKASVLYDEICLTYEREIIGHENLEEILSHMIMRLYAALFRLDDLKDDDDNDDDDDDDDLDDYDLLDDDEDDDDDDDEEDEDWDDEDDEEDGDDDDDDEDWDDDDDEEDGNDDDDEEDDNDDDEDWDDDDEDDDDDDGVDDDEEENDDDEDDNKGAEALYDELMEQIKELLKASNPKKK